MNKKFLFLGLGIASFFLFILILKDIKKPKGPKFKQTVEQVVQNNVTQVVQNNVTNVTTETNGKISFILEEKKEEVQSIKETEKSCEGRKIRKVKTAKVKTVKKDEEKKVEVVKSPMFYGSICIGGVCREISGVEGETISYRFYMDR